MTGFWLASYLVLWVFVVAMGALLLGVLHQLGVVLQQQAQSQGDTSGDKSGDEVPTAEYDGPVLSSPLPLLQHQTSNNFGMVDLSQPSKHGTLLVFLSTTCEPCQHLAEPLNLLVDNGVYLGRVVVIMRGDDYACKSFLSIFPLHIPVLCDADRTITMGFEIHNNPFGLFYSADGVLMRKGLVFTEDDLRALIGDTSVHAEYIYPKGDAAIVTSPARQ